MLARFALHCILLHVACSCCKAVRVLGHWGVGVHAYVGAQLRYEKCMKQGSWGVGVHVYVGFLLVVVSIQHVVDACFLLA